MLRLINTMEDLATLNEQISKYREYEESHGFTNQVFVNKIKMMERKRNSLRQTLQVLSNAY